jgi:ubiquinone/menaquinone biosynthesis C-methylase UbiE
MADDERKFFTDGAAYERLMGRWSRRAATVFIDWVAPPKGARWLDVGCGNGAFTEVMIARAAPAEVHGIDPSEAQIAYARTRAEARAAQFRVGDAQALPFEDASFDIASMALVITFVPDPAKAVREMARVVKPGGTVAAYMWDVEGGGLPPEPFRTGMIAIGKDPAWPPGSAASRASEMRRMWTEAGLETVETRKIDIQVDYADFDDFWQSNTVLAAPTARMIRDLTPAEVDRLKSVLRQSLPKDAQGRIAYGAWANAVKGRERR